MLKNREKIAKRIINNTGPMMEEANTRINLNLNKSVLQSSVTSYHKKSGIVKQFMSSSMIRLRNRTLSAPHRKGARHSIINHKEPIVLFEQYQDQIEELVAKNDQLILQSFSGTNPLEALPSLIQAFENVGYNELVVNCPRIVEGFIKPFQEFYTKERLSTILQFWPPCIPDTPKAKSLTLFLLKVLHHCNAAHMTMQYMANTIAHPRWHENPSTTNSHLKAICLCHRKRKVFNEPRFFWAYVMGDNQFHLDRIENGQLIKHTTGKLVDIEISRNGKIIRVILENKTKRLDPVELIQIDLWQGLHTGTLSPFPLMLTSIEHPLPHVIFPSLLECILADDLLFAKSLLHFSVVKVQEGLPLAEAFLNVFAYGGKVTQLLVMLSGIEFDSNVISSSMVLRGNTHLSCMFKVFFNKYGKIYYDKFLKKIVQYIDRCGNIGLRTPIQAPEKRVQQVFLTVLKNILRSGGDIPPQIKHFASILKACSISRFNSKQATFNTLSGFFLLRFVTAIIGDPKAFDPNIELPNYDQIGIFIPFSILIQMPFNLSPISGKFECFNTWNAWLQQNYYDAIIDFVYSIADYTEPAEYEHPSQEVLYESLETILRCTSQNHEAFANRYKSLMNSDDKWSEALSWYLCSFVSSFFKENLTQMFPIGGYHPPAGSEPQTDNIESDH